MRGRHHYNISIAAILFMGILAVAAAGCEKSLGLKDSGKDPVAVFDDVWNTMDQKYSLFTVKGVDWKNAYQTFRPQVSGDIGEDSLYRVLRNMLGVLKDGHVTLITPTDTFTYLGFYSAYPINFTYNNVLVNYLHNDYRTSGPLIYKIESGVGYLYYKSFSQDLTEEQVSKALADLAGTRGLIIDVRSNTGGNSLNADLLYRHLMLEKAVVKYELRKKGTAHDAFYAPDPWSLTPSENTYTAPVILLTNRSCFSACNDFALYMSARPNTRLMGDQTGGGGGIPQDFLLANGWKLQYTATVTLSPSGISIEPGIQPGVRVGISSVEEMSGKDPIIEQAFSALQ